MKIFLSILACVCLVIIILTTGLWEYSSYKNIVTKEKEMHKTEHKESKRKQLKKIINKHLKIQCKIIKILLINQ